MVHWSPRAGRVRLRPWEDDEVDRLAGILTPLLMDLLSEELRGDDLPVDRGGP